MNVLSSAETRKLYNRIAGVYDLCLKAFNAVGTNRWRSQLVAHLQIKPGDHVVDLCAGTGANLPYLAEKLGAQGKLTLVDLSEGMLTKAKECAERLGLTNVEIVQMDVNEFRFPPKVDAIISTFGLEMVPAYPAIIEWAVASLQPDGRIGLLGLKHPENWPDWLIGVGIFLTKPFAVSRDYEAFRPWIAARSFMDEQWFKQHLAGAAYSFVGQKKAVEPQTIHQSTLAKTHSSSQ